MSRAGNGRGHPGSESMMSFKLLIGCSILPGQTGMQVIMKWHFWTVWCEKMSYGAQGLMQKLDDYRTDPALSLEKHFLLCSSPL